MATWNHGSVRSTSSTEVATPSIAGIPGWTLRTVAYCKSLCCPSHQAATPSGWSVLAIDGHHTEGDYAFTVRGSP